MVRKTFASWQEQWDYIRENKDKIEYMVPVSAYGPREKDRKGDRGLLNKIGPEVYSIIFEIVLKD